MQLILKILSGMANSEDPNQSAPSGSGYALFACAILSEALVYKILGHLPHCLHVPFCQKLWCTKF